MALRDLLAANGDSLTDVDLADLADWAGRQKYAMRDDKDWQRPFALIREGADLTLRRRAQQIEKEKKTHALEKYPNSQP